MLMSYYDGKPFVRWYGRLNDTPNTLIISKIFRRRGIRLDNTYQVYDGELRIFPPKDYFCCENLRDGAARTDGKFLLHPSLRRVVEIVPGGATSLAPVRVTDRRQIFVR